MHALFETQKRKTNGAFTFSSKMKKSAIKYKSILKICPRPSVKFFLAIKAKQFHNIFGIYPTMFFWNAIFGVQKTNALIKCLNRSDLLYSSADTHRLAARISVADFWASQLLTVKLLKIGNMSNMGGSLSSWLWPDLFGLSIHSMVINNIWINNHYIFYTQKHHSPSKYLLTTKKN